VGPRAGLDDVEKRKFLILPGLELRPLGCPARNQSLYSNCPLYRIVEDYPNMADKFFEYEERVSGMIYK
jgi:hypothetical protein